MFWRILRRDMRRQKVMTAVLLIFTVLCSLFLGSSAVNIMATNQALDYFADLSHMADQCYVTLNTFEDEMEAWLRESPYAERYEKADLVQPFTENMVCRGTDAEVKGPYNFMVPGEDFNLMFDADNEVVRSVAAGEMAMSAERAALYGLEKGAVLDITIGDKVLSLKLTTMTKDGAFGKEGMSARVFINENDFRELCGGPCIKAAMWYVKTGDGAALRADFNALNIMTVGEFSRETMLTVFLVEKIIAVILAITAAVLLALALVLLKYSIRFTIEEEFREIGVMKAIGLKNRVVRRLYLVKYLAVSILGSAVGWLLTFPFCDMLIAPLKHSIIIPETDTQLFLRVFCAVAVVALTLLFAWRATRRVTRMPAIQAIREGASGERFERKGIIRLRDSRARVSLFMAGNDVLSGLKGFVSVFLALALAMLLIILPANMASTLSHKDSLEYLGLSQADAYALPPSSLAPGTGMTAYDDIRKALKNIEQEFADQGMDVDMDVCMLMSPKVYRDSKAGAARVSGFKHVTDKPFDVPCIAGSPPQFSNEISMTSHLLEDLGAKLGDTVTVVFGAAEENYIVTGEIQIMGYGGDSIIFTSAAEPDLAYWSGWMALLIDFADKRDIPGQIIQAQEKLPQYKVLNGEDQLRTIVGGIIDTLDSLVVSLVLLSALMVCLVVFLISHTLFSKDKPGIALLRSIGFTHAAIGCWQVARIVLVAVAAVVVGAGVSFMLNPLAVKMTFGLMGADRVPAQYDVFRTFVFYPLLILLGVVLTGALATWGIKKISLRHISGLE